MSNIQGEIVARAHLYRHFCYFKHSVNFTIYKCLNSTLRGERFGVVSSVVWGKPTRENLNCIQCGLKRQSAPRSLLRYQKYPMENGMVAWDFLWVILRQSATPEVWYLWLVNSGLFWIENFVSLSTLGKNNKITGKYSFLASACVAEWAIPAPNSKGNVVITEY